MYIYDEKDAFYYLYYYRFNMEIPRNYNPADFYIQKLAIYPKTREENLAQIEVNIFLMNFHLHNNRLKF
jgi:hypothetical protein